MPDLSRSLVLDFRADGSVECLLKDKVFDTRFLSDTRKIERVSEIVPTDDGQKFFIRWLLGPLVKANETLGRSAEGRSIRFYSSHGLSCEPNGETLYFDTYEDAVAEEIRTVNALRLAGISFQ